MLPLWIFPGVVDEVAVPPLRSGEPGVRITGPDGHAKDITPRRVKELEPEPRAEGGLKSVRFKDALPGSRGKKREPTQDELDFVKQLSGGNQRVQIVLSVPLQPSSLQDGSPPASFCCQQSLAKPFFRIGSRRTGRLWLKLCCCRQARASSRFTPTEPSAMVQAAESSGGKRCQRTGCFADRETAERCAT